MRSCGRSRDGGSRSEETRGRRPGRAAMCAAVLLGPAAGRREGGPARLVLRPSVVRVARCTWPHAVCGNGGEMVQRGMTCMATRDTCATRRAPRAPWRAPCPFWCRVARYVRARDLRRRGRQARPATRGAWRGVFFNVVLIAHPRRFRFVVCRRYVRLVRPATWPATQPRSEAGAAIQKRRVAPPAFFFF